MSKNLSIARKFHMVQPGFYHYRSADMNVTFEVIQATRVKNKQGWIGVLTYNTAYRIWVPLSDRANIAALLWKAKVGKAVHIG